MASVTIIRTTNIVGLGQLSAGSIIAVDDTTAANLVAEGAGIYTNTLNVPGGYVPGILTVTQAGSTGTDYSVNPPTIPNVGANFGTTGIYANYVLVDTIPADLARNNIEINNLSGSNLVIIRDAGSSSSGSAPVNASIIVLSPGIDAGSAGGFYSSDTFKGRIQLYVPAGVTSPFISVYKD